MTRNTTFLILLCLTLGSCSTAPKEEGKAINEYFWMYKENATGESYLGSIDDGEQLSDEYLGPIALIGYTESHIIIKEKSGLFYIQPYSHGQSLEEVKQSLIGPMDEDAFQKQMQVLTGSEGAGFELGE